MRYSDSHKEETRRKIVKAAAAAVRARGPDGVSVAEIMAEVGLTHGGFYAHFKSKEALVAAAIAEAFDQSRRRFGRMTEGLAAREALAVFARSYVSLEHRAHPQRGCPIAALATDMPRQGPLVRSAFDAGVAGLIGRLGAWLDAADVPERDGLASSMMVEMAGAVSLSRAVSDDALAEQLLVSTRERVLARAGVAAGTDIQS